jgi:5-methylcytosine-specific restriction protein B
LDSRGTWKTRIPPEKIPLNEIDPFTFFAFFQKLRNPVNRTEHLKKLKEIVGLKSEIPTDFNGLPSAQPMSAWYFRFKKNRDSKIISTLWQLAEQAVKGSVKPEAFSIRIV